AVESCVSRIRLQVASRQCHSCTDGEQLSCAAFSAQHDFRSEHVVGKVGKRFYFLFNKVTQPRAKAEVMWSDMDRHVFHGSCVKLLIPESDCAWESVLPFLDDGGTQLSGRSQPAGQ